MGVSNAKQMKEILVVDNVSLTYDGSKEILSNISLNVIQGEFISIIGPSGCGKSSLLNIIAGFVQATKGSILSASKPVSGPGSDRGVVFQDLALFPWLNVLENVSFGLRMKGVDKTARTERSMEAIRLVGLEGHQNANISDLSGGMKQRVAIARTIVNNPNILLLDEPFSALDAQTRDQLQEELLRIQQQTGMTVILVTHSIDEAVYLSDRVIALNSRPGSIQTIVNIRLERPRKDEVRVTPLFNEFKLQLMQCLRKGIGNFDEYNGSGI